MKSATLSLGVLDLAFWKLSKRVRKREKIGIREFERMLRILLIWLAAQRTPRFIWALNFLTCDGDRFDPVVYIDYLQHSISCLLYTSPSPRD